MTQHTLGDGVVITIPAGAVLGAFIEPENTKMTKLGFKHRFTQPERIAIRQAAASNPVVLTFRTCLILQPTLTLEDRAVEILSPPVLGIEQYNG